MTKVWQNRSLRWAFKIGVFAMIGLASASAFAEDGFFLFFPGNLIVSRSVYDNNPNNVTVGEKPCRSTAFPIRPTGDLRGNAIVNGIYPQVFNNDLVDGSFGLTSKDISSIRSPRSDFRWGRYEMPNNAQFPFPCERQARSDGDQLQLENPSWR